MVTSSGNPNVVKRYTISSNASPILLKYQKDNTTGLESKKPEATGDQAKVLQLQETMQLYQQKIKNDQELRNLTKDLETERDRLIARNNDIRTEEQLRNASARYKALSDARDNRAETALSLIDRINQNTSTEKMVSVKNNFSSIDYTEVMDKPIINSPEPIPTISPEERAINYGKNTIIDPNLNPADAFRNLVKPQYGILTPSGQYVNASRNGEQIDPTSTEGKTIQSIYASQFETRALNQAQRTRFDAITSGNMTIGEALFSQNTSKFYKNGKETTGGDMELTELYLGERGLSLEDPLNQIRIGVEKYDRTRDETGSFVPPDYTSYRKPNYGETNSWTAIPKEERTLEKMTYNNMVNQLGSIGVREYMTGEGTAKARGRLPTSVKLTSSEQQAVTNAFEKYKENGSATVTVYDDSNKVVKTVNVNLSNGETAIADQLRIAKADGYTNVKISQSTSQEYQNYPQRPDLTDPTSSTKIPSTASYAILGALAMAGTSKKIEKIDLSKVPTTIESVDPNFRTISGVVSESKKVGSENIELVYTENGVEKIKVIPITGGANEVYKQLNSLGENAENISVRGSQPPPPPLIGFTDVFGKDNQIAKSLDDYFELKKPISERSAEGRSLGIGKKGGNLFETFELPSNQLLATYLAPFANAGAETYDTVKATISSIQGKQGFTTVEEEIPIIGLKYPKIQAIERTPLQETFSEKILSGKPVDLVNSPLDRAGFFGQVSYTFGELYGIGKGSQVTINKLDNFASKREAQLLVNTLMSKEDQIAFNALNSSAKNVQNNIVKTQNQLNKVQKKLDDIKPTNQSQMNKSSGKYNKLQQQKTELEKQLDTLNQEKNNLLSQIDKKFPVRYNIVQGNSPSSKIIDIQRVSEKSNPLEPDYYTINKPFGANNTIEEFQIFNEKIVPSPSNVNELNFVIGKSEIPLANRNIRTQVLRVFNKFLGNTKSVDGKPYEVYGTMTRSQMRNDAYNAFLKIINKEKKIPDGLNTSASKTSSNTLNASQKNWQNTLNKNYATSNSMTNKQRNLLKKLGLSDDELANIGSTAEADIRIKEIAQQFGGNLPYFKGGKLNPLNNSKFKIPKNLEETLTKTSDDIASKSMESAIKQSELLAESKIIKPILVGTKYYNVPLKGGNFKTSNLKNNLIVGEERLRYFENMKQYIDLLSRKTNLESQLSKGNKNVINELNDVNSQIKIFQNNKTLGRIKKEDLTDDFIKKFNKEFEKISGDVTGMQNGLGLFRITNNPDQLLFSNILKNPQLGIDMKLSNFGGQRVVYTLGEGAKPTVATGGSSGVTNSFKSFSNVLKQYSTKTQNVFTTGIPKTGKSSSGINPITGKSSSNTNLKTSSSSQTMQTQSNVFTQNTQSKSNQLLEDLRKQMGDTEDIGLKIDFYSPLRYSSFNVPLYASGYQFNLLPQQQLAPLKIKQTLETETTLVETPITSTVRPQLIQEPLSETLKNINTPPFNAPKIDLNLDSNSKTGTSTTPNQIIREILNTGNEEIIRTQEDVKIDLSFDQSFRLEPITTNITEQVFPEPPPPVEDIVKTDFFKRPPPPLFALPLNPASEKRRRKKQKKKSKSKKIAWDVPDWFGGYYSPYEYTVFSGREPKKVARRSTRQ